MKILVIDDDPRIREALAVGMQLQSQDAHVLSAADGEAGLELFFGEQPDVILALLARIRAVLRRAELPSPVQALPDFQAGDLAIHFQNQEVTLAGQEIRLTPVAATRSTAEPCVGHGLRSESRVSDGVHQPPACETAV